MTDKARVECNVCGHTRKVERPKPCPFCGATFFCTDTKEGTMWQASHSDGCFLGPGHQYLPLDDTAEWNTRAAPEPQRTLGYCKYCRHWGPKGPDHYGNDSYHYYSVMEIGGAAGICATHKDYGCDAWDVPKPRLKGSCGTCKHWSLYREIEEALGECTAIVDWVRVKRPSETCSDYEPKEE